MPFSNVGRMYYFSLKILPKRMPRDCSTAIVTSCAVLTMI
ncbi:NAD-dependent malic enzyme, partial [Klebsiella variicola]